MSTEQEISPDLAAARAGIVGTLRGRVIQLFGPEEGKLAVHDQIQIRQQLGLQSLPQGYGLPTPRQAQNVPPVHAEVQLMMARDKRFDI